MLMVGKGIAIPLRVNMCELLLVWDVVVLFDDLDDVAVGDDADADVVDLG